MNDTNTEIARLAGEILELTKEDNASDCPPSLSIHPTGEAVEVLFADYEDWHVKVPWNNIFESLQCCTTEEEAMSAITRMKEVIERYEAWHGRTHDEWLADTQPDPDEQSINPQ